MVLSGCLCVCVMHSLLVGPRPPTFHFNGCCLCCITHTLAYVEGRGAHTFLILTVVRSLCLLSCHLCGDATLTRSHFYFYAANLFLQADPALLQRGCDLTVCVGEGDIDYDRVYIKARRVRSLLLIWVMEVCVEERVLSEHVSGFHVPCRPLNQAVEVSATFAEQWKLEDEIIREPNFFIGIPASRGAPVISRPSNCAVLSRTT